MRENDGSFASAAFGLHHVSFSVTDLERTITFYRRLGFTLRSRTHNAYDQLGEALFGTKWGISRERAELEIAVMQLGEQRVEFIGYVDPPASSYHMNPSVAGSAHMALWVKDIEAERGRLEQLGVEFHSSVNVFHESGKSPWKWCYFRDPDGICVELVEADSR